MAGEIDLTGRRVVVADDEGVTVLQLSKMLAKHGMEVVGIARDGQEAVNLVLMERPEIVMMDITMPVLDGLEAARRILAEYKTCIVMLTAYSDDATIEEAFAAGASGFIVKPVDSGYLPQALKRALEKHADCLPEKHTSPPGEMKTA